MPSVCGLRHLDDNAAKSISLANEDVNGAIAIGLDRLDRPRKIAAYDKGLPP